MAFGGGLFAPFFLCSLRVVRGLCCAARAVVCGVPVACFAVSAFSLPLGVLASALPPLLLLLRLLLSAARSFLGSFRLAAPAAAVPI